MHAVGSEATKSSKVYVIMNNSRRSPSYSLRFAAAIWFVMVGWYSPLYGTPKYPSEMYLGIYLGQAKLGYTVMRSDKAEWKGSPVIKSESSSRTEISVMGTKVTQEVETLVYTDLKSRPLYEEFAMSSSGKSTKVYADFKDREIQCRLVTKTGETQRAIPIPEGVKLVGDEYTAMEGESIKVGDTMTQHTFNPLTLSLDELKISVDRKQNLEIDGKSVETLVITTKTPLGDLVSYQGVADQELLKIEASMGIVMLRETKQKAMGKAEGEYQPPPDLAVSTSVKADKNITDADGLWELNIRLSGMPQRSMIISDKVQKASRARGAGSQAVTFEIKVREYEASESGTLPVGSEGLTSALEPGMYVKSRDDSVVRQARKIVGSDRNLFRAASLIRNWVRDEMKPDASIGVLRPSGDILKDRRGVCRDYAILYASLARAAGIPTRIIGGLLLHDNRLYYHAWNEVWTGKGWVPMDSTRASEVFGANHIKLTEGDETEMFKMGKVIGQLKAEILDYK